MTGTIKSFSDRHGYGFIVGELNEIFFAHKTEFRYRYPKPGDKVVFDTEASEKGIRAKDIRRRRWQMK